MRRDALESRASRGIRAYVTGGDRPPVHDARNTALRTCYGLTPHRVGELDGSRHTCGAKAFARTPPVGGDLG